MPIKVLKNHGVINKDGELVSLNVKKLTLEQKAVIKKICEEKIQEYIASRGLSIWDYRLLDDNPVPDSLRFRVLKEAKGRCSLCGSTKDERPLDVDHIIPRSRHGKTEYSNLQALCSKCNRSKRDEDSTDFRSIIQGEAHDDCPFCTYINSGEKLIENEYAVAKLDKYPVTNGHTLVIPKRHFSEYFDITQAEQNGIYELVRIRRKQLIEEDSSIEGFNVGVNSGKVAGQTVFHCHVHLIPRRKGDIEDPRGGIRGAIPNKMKYREA
jgi:diadenosine tetraphosphate (Ap4A) HIT family hydrolase